MAKLTHGAFPVEAARPTVMSTRSNTESRFRQSEAQLESRGQEHVLRWWGDLSRGEREHLLTDIESVPWEILDGLFESHVIRRPEPRALTDLSPAPVYPRQPAPDQEAIYIEAERLGQDLIHAGKIAAFTVAGGQGTRLGFEGPKGAVTITPVREKTLFQVFAETIRAAGGRYKVNIPWYIMTNPANHEQTVGFLKDHDYFELPPNDVIPFAQGMLPAFDFSGRILLQDKYRLALAPDGHGGSLKALVGSGALDDMRARGIEVVSYFQVDNPLVKPFDPLFIGLHVKTGSEMSTKVTPKADDLERVGNLCVRAGKVMVVEYSDFPDELAHARNPDGTRKFDVGNLAIHLLNVSFIERVIAKRFDLPFRRAEKTVTWMDENGFLRTPREANAVKLETFVFDAIPLANSQLLLEVDRTEEFSPVKNAKGVDSVETATRDQIDRACRWLEAAGVAIPRKPDGEPNITIEIAPSYALDAEEVKPRVTTPPTFDPGETIYIA